MDLRNLGYEIEESRESRRQELKKLILNNRFRPVYRNLKGTKELVTGEKEDKVRNDLNWLIRRYKKGMYSVAKMGFDEKLDKFALQILEEYDSWRSAEK